MRARDIMTPRLVTVSPDATVLETARVLLGEHINAALVVGDDGALRGIVSEADLMRRPEIGSERERSWWLRAFADSDDLAREYMRSHARKVRDAMTAAVVTVGEDTPVAEIADLFHRRGIKTVPVMRNGRPIGMVSRANLLQALVAQGEARAIAPASDETIRATLLREFDKQAWADSWAKNVIVENGVVHLWGVAQTEREKEACRVAAEVAPGVREVVNHIVVRNLPMHAY
jgi:CBS domain-containing protein